MLELPTSVCVMYIGCICCFPLNCSAGPYQFQLLGDCGGQGIIEINDSSGYWPRLCSVNGSTWDVHAARQICRQLGYQDAISAVCCDQSDPLLSSDCWGRNESSVPERCSFTDDSVCNSTTSAIVSCTRELMDCCRRCAIIFVAGSYTVGAIILIWTFSGN